MRRLISNLIIILILISGITLYGAIGTPSNLVVKTDANNYLLVTAVTQTNPVTQGIFSSRTLRTDASGSLQVVLTGTVTPTYPQAIPASTCAAPSLGMSGNTDNGIAFTVTPSILNCIEGATALTISATSITGPATTFNIQSQSGNSIIINAQGSGSGLNLRQSGNDTIALGGPSSTARTITFTNGTFTTDLQAINNTVTWNAAGVTFTGWKLNVTDTASAAASLLMDLQVGAASKFSLTKAGLLTTITATVTSGANLNNIGIGSGHGTMNARFTSAGAALVTLADNAGTSGSVLEFLEQTAPSAGAANTARIYAVDNGSGKTQVCALFSSGAAQCFATQP